MHASFLITSQTAMFSTRHSRLSPTAFVIYALLSAGLALAGSGPRPAQAQRVDALETDTTSQVETRTRKSRGLARMYSLSGTIMPIFLANATDNAMLLIGGILVGPSLGHFYAGNTGHALTGIGLRLGGGAVGAVGFGAALNASLEGDDGGGGVLLALTGALTVLISGGYDIFSAAGAARDYNETHGLKARLAPTAGPEVEQVGLSMQLQF